MRRAIRFVDMTAFRAFTRRVARVHLDHWNACDKRLIQHKHLQLIERPRMQNRSLLSPDPYPITNSSQLLDCYSASGAFGIRNNLLTNYVVYMVGKALFFVAQFLQATVRRSRTELLKFAAKAPLPMSHALYFAAIVALAIGVCSYVGYSEIHPEKVIYIAWLGSFYVARSCQIKLPTMVQQIRFSLPILQEHLLAHTAFEGDMLPTVGRPDRDSLLNDVPGKKPVIVGEGSMLAERALDLFVKLVGIHDLGYGANHHLGGQGKALAGFVVYDLVQRRLPELLMLPRLLADPVAGPVSGFERLSQQRALFAYNDLDFGCQLHYASIVEHKAPLCQQLARLLSWLKPEVSGAEVYS